MFDLPKKTVELVEPRKWWQFKGKRVLQKEWFVESVNYSDGITIILLDKETALKRYRRE